jgi:hypothetical protein
VHNVTKARLFSLLVLAILVAQVLGWCFKPIGFSDGGFW